MLKKLYKGKEICKSQLTHSHLDILKRDTGSAMHWLSGASKHNLIKHVSVGKGGSIIGGGGLGVELEAAMGRVPCSVVQNTE